MIQLLLLPIMLKSLLSACSIEAIILQKKKKAIEKLVVHILVTVLLSQ